MRRLLLLAVSILLIPGALFAAGSIEGRWRLVEERRGSGEANLLAPGEGHLLELAREGAGVARSGLAGRIRPADPAAAPRPWPSFETGEAPLSVRVESVAVAPGFSGVSARYRAGPAAPNGREILVEETYRLEAEGRSLSADIRVTDVVDGKEGGSYLLHRRYERER